MLLALATRQYAVEGRIQDKPLAAMEEVVKVQRAGSVPEEAADDKGEDLYPSSMIYPHSFPHNITRSNVS